MYLSNRPTRQVDESKMQNKIKDITIAAQWEMNVLCVNNHTVKTGNDKQHISSNCMTLVMTD